MPPDHLESGGHAELRRNGEPTWVLSWKGEVDRANDRRAYETVGFGGSGPFVFRAPPEPGVYEMCKGVSYGPRRSLRNGNEDDTKGGSSGSGVACAPVEVTRGTTEQRTTFDLEVVAPASVEAGAPFDVAIRSDVPPDELSDGPYAEMRQDERSAWVLLESGEVIRMRDFHTPLVEDRGDHGPWTFTASPEPGAYELCMTATRRVVVDGMERYAGEEEACTAVEVVEA